MNVILFSMSIITLCACAFFLLGVNYGDQIIKLNMDHSFEVNLIHFGYSLYYSVVTFTTLGYGDITPFGATRFIAAIEAFCGSFTLALFVVVFVKKMTR